MNDLNVIDRFLATFIRYIDSGFGLLGPDVGFLTSTLIGIDITLAGLFWAMGGEDNVIGRFIRKILYVGAFAFILNRFSSLADIIFRSFAAALQGQEPDIGQALSLVLASLTLFGLGIFGPGIASGLVAGAPQLGAGAALGTAVGAAGVTALAGGAAVGAASAVGGAALGAVRAGTAMGSAASASYQLGQSAAGSSSVGAGLGGVARAAGNTVRQKASSALGLPEAAQSGRDAAWTALNGSAASGQSTGSADGGAPQWAQSLRRQQDSRHHRQVALQTLKEGDRGGASATPDIKEKDD